LQKLLQQFTATFYAPAVYAPVYTAGSITSPFFRQLRLSKALASTFEGKAIGAYAKARRKAKAWHRGLRH